MAWFDLNMMVSNAVPGPLVVQVQIARVSLVGKTSFQEDFLRSFLHFPIVDPSYLNDLFLLPFLLAMSMVVAICFPATG